MMMMVRHRTRTTDCPFACNSCTLAASHRTVTLLFIVLRHAICSLAMTESHLDSASLACSASVPRLVVECLGDASGVFAHGFYIVVSFSLSLSLSLSLSIFFHSL
jgi:hypothetical protein